MKYLELNTKTIDDMTVYQYLKSQGFSEHYLSKLRKDKNNILLNDTSSSITEKINNKILKINKNPYKQTEIKLVDKPIDIIFEDEDYLVVNKPSNLASIPTRSHYNDNLAGRICSYMSKKDDNFTLRILNRLDKDACGLIVIPLHAIQKTTVLQKEYHAICHGVIKDEISIEEPILTMTNNGINEIKRVISPLGQYAKTTIIPIKTFDNLTLVKVYIEKGRTHQIRLHSSHINHPLIGDSIYGFEDGYNHTFLCLKKISFRNENTEMCYEFEIEYPKDFLNILNKNNK